ncbi:MAG: alanine racemase domain protein [Frankiales bacterium]|nr:alanine racemase domain protein [Frankiales bacterium]
MSSDPSLTVSLPVPVSPYTELPLSLADPRIDTPAVLVDLEVAEQNIARMASYAGRAGVALRPHAKTHKSSAMATRQLAAGAAGLTVATAGEAQVMVKGGVPDVTVAYPLVGRAKLDRVLEALGAAEVTLTTDSDAVTDAYADLARRAGRTLNVLVEVDTGMHRAGAPPQLVVDRARHIAGTPGLDFAGILTHAGHAHDVPGPRGIAVVARQEATVMGDLRSALEKAGLPPRVVSAGSTLTAPYLCADDGITELRPGTYVYNDLRTLACWSCTPDALAATVLTTVVSTDGGRVTIDAGSKTLTTTQDPHYGFGHPAGAAEVSVARLSEEHGVLAVPDDHRPYAVGDRLQILPVHVCVWMDLQPEVYGVRNGQIVERITVDAMRHSL